MPVVSAFEWPEGHHELEACVGYLAKFVRTAKVAKGPFSIIKK